MTWYLISRFSELLLRNKVSTFFDVRFLFFIPYQVAARGGKLGQLPELLMEASGFAQK